jgi:hypothetical protein
MCFSFSSCSLVSCTGFERGADAGFGVVGGCGLLADLTLLLVLLLLVTSFLLRVGLRLRDLDLDLDRDLLLLRALRDRFELERLCLSCSK